ncbi:hypothetical protein FOZ61_008935 [Perkinsus olseni]|uniref:Uncharacterized protein n=1 Tax=Perkinsus olseni TaxID=32597 RepID=A0A7J6L242_PEROL|nr:hypothetical protein FOZ61_008935 [Perkinsus olseni]KAF4655952.1 hypothetical protein FOL46_008061 [Perkinsus olseni]
MLSPGQPPLVSAQYPLAEGGPEKYFVDFQAKDGGSFSDLQTRATSLGTELSVINFVGPNFPHIRSKGGFLFFRREALPLSQGAYVYVEDDSFKMTIEVAEKMPEEFTRQVKIGVTCSLGEEMLQVNDLSTTFEVEDQPLAVKIDPSVGRFFQYVAETCSMSDLLDSRSDLLSVGY